MHKLTVLKKGIEKAIKNNWDSRGYYLGMDEDTLQKFINDDKHLSIIFSHDFAKAIWGEEDIIHVDMENGKTESHMKIWQWHLQQMVLCEEPLQYLKMFI